MDLKGRMLHLVQSDGKDTKYLVTEKEPLNLPAPLVSIVTGAFWTMHFLYSSQNGTLLVCRERWSEPRDAPHAEVPRAESADHSPSPESLRDESCPHQTPTHTWRRLSHVACKPWSWAAWTASLPEGKGVPTKAPTAAINLLCYSLYTCYSKMGLVKY